jgi:heme exporter protein A
MGEQERSSLAIAEAGRAAGRTEAPPAIEVRRLVKSFGHRVALRGVDLIVQEGEFLTLFGPNGAGKTTLLRIVASLAQPSGGTVLLRGQDLGKAPPAQRRHIGLISHNPLLYGDLTADENLRFFARLYDLGDGGARIDQVLSQVGLAARRREPVRNYSRGMVQRLAIARAILPDPDIVLLDEPYTGLDLQAADMLGSVLEDLVAASRTVILTTHNLEQGLEMCDRAAVLHRGKVAWQGIRGDVDLGTMKAIYRNATSGT